MSRLEALDRAREAATAEVGRWHQESARLERRVSYADKLDREKNTVFQGVYRDPQKAQARFEQLAAAKGIGRATRTLEERPESFGRVRGWGIGPLRSQERLEALETAREAGGAARKAAAMSKAVAKENGQRVDARVKLDAAHHRQRQEAERMPERRQLVREIAMASRGLTDEQWKGLGRDQQKAVTQARQSVKAEQDRSRGRGRGIDR